MRPLIASLLIVALALVLPPRKTQAEDAKPDKILLDKDKAEWKVYVAYEGYEPRVHPDPAKTEVVKLEKPIGFMDAFYVAKMAEQEWFYLVTSVDDGKTIKDHIGWVPRQYLVTSFQAMLSRQGIVRKVLIVNRQGELPKDEKLDEVRFRPSPRNDVKGRNDPARLYTPMFVFGEADGMFLVGDAPAFSRSVDKKPSDVVLGWIPKARLEEWATREASEWDHESTLEPGDRPIRLPKAHLKTELKERRTTPGRIYASIEDAHKGLKGEPAKTIFTETEFRKEGRSYPVSPKLEKKAPRFPLLGTADEGPNNNVLYKVGGIGGLVDADGKVMLDSAEVAKLISIIDDLRDLNKQTDLLFVIDDTKSMGRFYKAVASTVRKVTDLARRNTVAVRVGVMFYNDLPKGSKEDAKSPNTWIPLTDVSESGEKIARAVEEHEAKGGGDMHEMLYRGLAEGLAKAEPNPKARKIVVLIGDCGDISGSAERRKTDPWYMKKYNPASIVRTLCPEDEAFVPWEFYAIRVPGPADDSADAERDFLTQIQALHTSYGTVCKERMRRQLGDAFNEKDFFIPGAVFDSGGDGEGKIQLVLESRYKRLADEISRMESSLVALRRGQWSTALTKENERELDAELKDKGLKITIEELRKRGGAQIFQTGYVWANNADGLPQMRRLVLLSEKEINDLVKFLKSIDLDDTTRVDAIKQIIERQAKANAELTVTPETLRPLSLDTVRKQARGLAFRKGILKATYDDLATGRVTLRQQEFYDLKFSSSLLQDVAESTAYRYDVKEHTSGGTTYKEYFRVPKSDTSADRSFNLGKDTSLKFYYLDYEEEWP